VIYETYFLLIFDFAAWILWRPRRAGSQSSSSRCGETSAASSAATATPTKSNSPKDVLQGPAGRQLPPPHPPRRMGHPRESGSFQGFFLLKGVVPCHSRPRLCPSRQIRSQTVSWTGPVLALWGKIQKRMQINTLIKYIPSFCIHSLACTLNL